ncbi:MAG TPA: glycoside hydrolase family 28 protein [Verrucomicrobiae bacterium]
MSPQSVLNSPLIISLAFIFILIVGAAGCASTHSSKDDPQAAAAGRAWSTVPAILANIIPPKFPHRDFDVTHYGAQGDGVTDCSEAFRKAIDDCSQSGGGRVMVPAGVYLTGPIHLENNVDLYVAKEATIRFSTNMLEYLPPVFTRYEGTEVMNYSPLIYAFEQTNIAVTGEGTLDGQGAAWQAWRSPTDPNRLVKMAAQGVPASQRIFGDHGHLRPNFFQPVRCRNVLVQDVRLINSPMWVLTPCYCTNVTIRGVTVDTKGANTDGCDPDSDNGVLIEGCNFSDGDDCISVKSGRDHDGQQINIPCQNIVIRDCVFQAGHGGIALGSETSGGIQNVFGENDHFNSPDLEMALRFKTNPARGGFIENIYVRNCTIKTAQFGIHMTLRYSSSGAMQGGSLPIIRNIDIRDCRFLSLTRAPIFIQGWSPEDEITAVTIADCRFPRTVEKSAVTDAAGIYLPGTEGSGLEQKTE